MRVAKRKNDGPTVTKASKAKKNESSKGKDDTDVIIQLRTLQKKFDELADENQRNIEKIQTLEDTISRVNNKDNSSKSNLKSVSVQTVLFEEDIMRCNECEFPAEDIYDLGEHMYEFHGDGAIDCYYCDDSFKTKREMMNHRKTIHADKVNTCSNFSEGHCEFNESCWYKHSTSVDSKTDIKCRICEKMFSTKYEFMHHKKKEHSQTVPQCKNESSGTCRFGIMNCWFNHCENEQTNFYENHQNNEVIEKLFSMMEIFTKRIVDIENKI